MSWCTGGQWTGSQCTIPPPVTIHSLVSRSHSTFGCLQYGKVIESMQQSGSKASCMLVTSGDISQFLCILLTSHHDVRYITICFCNKKLICISTITLQENQAVHDELRRAAEERESLKLKVQEYAQSILRYEEAIAVKVSLLQIH